MRNQGISYETIRKIILNLPKPQYMDVIIHGSFNIYILEEQENTAEKIQVSSSKREVNQGSIWYRDEEITKQDVLKEFQRLVSDREQGSLAVYWRNIDGCVDVGLTPYCLTFYRESKQSPTITELRSILENSDVRISFTPLPLIKKPLEE